MLEADETLYARAREGEMRAFDALYARYEGPLFGFILSQLRHRPDAEDVFHETFVNALKAKVARFEGPGGFRAWIYRIARNLVSNRARTARRGLRAMAALGEAPETHGVHGSRQAASGEQAIADRELQEALDRAIERLPPALSEVFHLRASGLRYEEMADVLEIPLGTIKSRMNQMVTQLREELRPWTVG
jgi:RNA polymerase sigma-70 factor (ECF subfamily)